jgi:hypothetical protein
VTVQQFWRNFCAQITRRKMKMTKVDFSAIEAAVQAQVDAAVSAVAAPAPVNGISADQEAADIAAAVSAAVAAIQADDDKKTALIASIKALLV